MNKAKFFNIFIISILSVSMFSCTGVRKGAFKAADDSWSFVKGIFKKQDDPPKVPERDVLTKEEYVWEKVEKHLSDTPDVIETVSEEIEGFKEKEEKTEIREENPHMEEARRIFEKEL